VQAVRYLGCPARSSAGTSGRSFGKRIVEELANQCYWLELDNAPGQRVWANRKAAWAIEDLEQDVGLIYRQMGRKGLEGIENVGPRLAEVVGDLISEWTYQHAK
jgi:DNA polymerase/3'-5' exonuclease PolX